MWFECNFNILHHCTEHHSTKFTLLAVHDNITKSYMCLLDLSDVMWCDVMWCDVMWSEVIVSTTGRCLVSSRSLCCLFMPLIIQFSFGACPLCLEFNGNAISWLASYLSFVASLSLFSLLFCKEFHEHHLSFLFYIGQHFSTSNIK